jgi:hypothetical protein
MLAWMGRGQRAGCGGVPKKLPQLPPRRRALHGLKLGLWVQKRAMDKNQYEILEPHASRYDDELDRETCQGSGA